MFSTQTVIRARLAGFAFLFFLGVSVFPIASAAAPDSDQGSRTPHIQDVRIEGLSSLPGDSVDPNEASPTVETVNGEDDKAKRKALKASVSVEKEIREKMSLRQGDILSARRVREDIHALFETGRFEDVRIFAEQGKKKDQVILVVQVKERPSVRKLSIEGNEKKKDKKLSDQMKTTFGRALDPAALGEDVEAIKKLYREDGYNSAAVRVETKVSDDGRAVEVTLSIQEGIQVKVGRITFTGNEAYLEKKVRSRLKNLKEGKKYRPDKVEEDRKQLEEFYRNEGYLRCVVDDPATQTTPDGRLVNLSFTIHEGVPYKLADLTVEGATVVTPEDMVKVARLEKGALLRQKDLEDARERMRSLYLDKGYIYCRVEHQVDYDEDARTATVRVKTEEGQVAFIQDVRITGNYKTRDYVIRRELSMKPGEKFEVGKIRASTMSLYNLGFFEEVNPEMEPGDKPGQAVLVYRVKERKTGSIGLGGGYSSVDKWVGNLKFEEANLFGRGQRLNLNWEFGRRTNSFDVGFTEPFLFNTRTSGTINLFNTIHILDAYTERRTGGSIGFGRRLSRRWSVFNSYLYERVKVYDVAVTYQDPLQANYIPTTTNRTSSITPRVVYDSRDNVFDARHGWRHALSVEIAGGPFGADNNFIKTTSDTSKFMPLLWKFVLGEHIRLGYAKGYRARGRMTDVPIYERFYCGGTDTVRGYDERVIGPNRGVSGGRVLFVMNNEIKYPIAGPLRGVFFFDTGGLWSDLKYVKNNLQCGGGVGVRLTIPGTVMAVRVDYGWPINSNIEGADKKGKLHFNLGDIF